jgi:hypothetical protein
MFAIILYMLAVLVLPTVSLSFSSCEIVQVLRYFSLPVNMNFEAQ